MASRAVVSAVAARLAAANLGVPVYGPNELGEAPADGSTFIAVEYPLTIPPDQMTIGSPGSNRIREHGAILLIIAAGRTFGVDVGLTLADTLMALFRNAEFGGVRCWLPSPPASDDRNEDGNFYKLQIAVPYWHDTDNG